LGYSSLLTALTRLDERAVAEAALHSLGKELGSNTLIKKLNSKKSPTDVKQLLELTKALYSSRRFSRVQYVFHVSAIIEDVHMDRESSGAYDIQLNPITQAMNRIKKRHGLRKHQYFKTAEAPSDYIDLDKKYNNILDENFVALLREYGFDDLADLVHNNSEEYYRLRERGRRNLIDASELQFALRDLVIKYETDAKKAADAGAYYAAIALLGAGIEGLLLLRCLGSKRKALVAASTLPRRLKTRAHQPITTWTFEILIEVCSNAGWLAKIKITDVTYLSAGIAHYLRNLRNLLHPAKHAQISPWTELERRDFEDADAMYTILLNTLSYGDRLKQNVAP
jgi:hypothetical protein